MSKINQPTGQQLTPENLLRIALCGGHLNPAVSKLVTQAMKECAAQQTASLREEMEAKDARIEELEKIKDSYKAYYEAALKHCENYNKELEAVKKQRGG